MTMTSENPTPLSPDALSVLARALENPVPIRSVTPAIRYKLEREGWAEVVYGDRPRPALQITEKGKARIAFEEP